MMMRSGSGCCVVLWLMAQSVFAANTEPRPSGRGAVGSQETPIRAADARKLPTIAGNKARSRKPVKSGAQMKRQSSARNPRFEPWNIFLDKCANVGSLGFRLFPLALFMQGKHAVAFLAADQSNLPVEMIRDRFSRRFVEQYFQRRD